MTAAVALPDGDIRGLRAGLCASDLALFAEYVGHPFYRAARHHELIARALERVATLPNQRLIITMPPRHGKSQLASVYFPAWFLGTQPDRKVMACSYAAALAYKFSRQARNVMLGPRWPFPAVQPARDLRNVSSWDIEGHRGGYVAAGVGGSVTGMGASILLVDDPVKSREEADSEKVRQTNWDWFTGTALTRVEAGGSVVLIGTRWHEDDLIGRALQMDGVGWDVLSLQAICDADDDPLGRAPGQALWPEMYDADWLDRQRTMISSREWEAQYQARPAPATGAVFQRDWWRRYGVLPEITAAEITVDSAFKTGVGSDYSAIALWGTDGGGNYYCLDVRHARLEFPDLIRAIHDFHAAARARFPRMAVPVVIEDAASGQSAVQVLSRQYTTPDGHRLPALPVIPWTIRGTSKIARAESVAPLVEAGRVWLPESAAWVSAFVEEHAGFPTAAHDDMVDTTSMALARLSRPRASGVRSF